MESVNSGSANFLHGTRAAVIFTTVAMVMCAASLSLPFYVMTYHDEVLVWEEVFVVDERFVFHLDYLRVVDRTYWGYDGTSMEEFMDGLVKIIVAWLVLGTVYIASCILGSRALIRGLVLQFFCVIPVVYFMAGMPSAIEGTSMVGWHQLFVPDNFWGSSHPYEGRILTWGPASGWFLLVLACVIQVAVITRRNAPMAAALLTRRIEMKKMRETSPESETG